MLVIGWVLLALECLLALLFGYLFWHFWSRSAMKRAIALRAIIVYAVGCFFCLLLMLSLPL